jgi:hypothetical protein
MPKPLRLRQSDHSTTRFYAVLEVTQAEMDPGSEESYTIPLADRLLTSTIKQFPCFSE